MKILLILSLLASFTYSDNEYELRLYEEILPRFFADSKALKIYPDAKTNKIIRHSNIFDIVFTCKDADLLMGKHFDNTMEQCSDKPIFSTSYSDFKNKENSFATFYWRKGRPQIKFKRSAIKKFHLSLPTELDKYAH